MGLIIQTADNACCKVKGLIASYNLLISFGSWISDALPLTDKMFQHNVTTKILRIKTVNRSVSYRTGLTVVVVTLL
jgi:hypothetical protein